MLGSGRRTILRSVSREMPMSPVTAQHTTVRRIVDLSEVGLSDVGLVGGKGANRGEMIASGFPVPPGFVITAEAYLDAMEHAGLAGHELRGGTGAVAADDRRRQLHGGEHLHLLPGDRAQAVEHPSSGSDVTALEVQERFVELHPAGQSNGARLLQIFWPLSSHPPSVGVAVDRSDARSLPDSGSDQA